MATQQPIKGLDRVLVFDKINGSSAGTLAFETENSLSESRDTESTMTKGGRVTSGGGYEATLSCTTLVSASSATLTTLRTAIRKGTKIEGWRVDTSGGIGEPTAKYPAIYFQGTVTSYEESAPAEGDAEASIEIAIDGVPQEGTTAFTKDQQESLQYAFKEIAGQ